MPTKNCEQCGKEYNVIPARMSTSRYCSNACKFAMHGWSGEPNTECTHCKKMFHLKPSKRTTYKRVLGYFCSNVCAAENKRVSYAGIKNPNYRGRTHDFDGYPVRIYPEQCVSLGGIRRMKIHQAVCCELLGVSAIGSGLHVHHRDCDVENNSPDNLSVLTISDHKWLHKQFGNATLWAHSKGMITTEFMASWSDDKERATTLLDACITNQSVEELGAVIDGKLCAHAACADQLVLPQSD